MAKYSSYILYLLIAILVVILYANGVGPLDSMQRSLNDLLHRMTASEDSPSSVAVVMIDGQSMDKYGQWPWNRDRLADLVAATASGEPKVILIDVDLFEDASQDSAGYTDILASQLAWIPNVVLPYDIALATYRINRTTKQDYLFKNSVSIDSPIGLMDDDASLLVRKVFLPADKILDTKVRLGFDYISPDNDRVLRRQSQVMQYEGFYYPSASLVTAGLFLDVPPDQMVIREGKEIDLAGVRSIPIDNKSRMFLNFTVDNAFVRYSASDILSEDFDRSVLAGMAVVIVVDDVGLVEFFETPVNKETPAYLVRATALSNIINEQFLIEKNNQAGLDMLILVIIGGICAFLLPRVVLLHRLLILAGGLIVLINVNYFFVSSFQTLPNTVYIMLELLLFMVASPLLESQLLTGELAGRAPKPERPRRVVEGANRAKRDTADLPPAREIKASASDSGGVETVALGQNDGQSVVSDHSAISLDDTPTRHTGLNDSGSSETISPAMADSGPIAGLTDSGGNPQASDEIRVPEGRDVGPAEEDEDEPLRSVDMSESQKMQLQQQAPDLSNLGRYQVTGILGKGAMGLVYRGVDPAINRPVALKTIRLDFVNDPEELEELKERLYREAQAAGKLSHPNIVTIYDVGSEGPLQYIAMEFLEGVTLEELIKTKTKFNYRIISQILMQICSALEYAHNQGIVHRDIKPANIMILSDYRVKVMDYGIARVDSNSMTKTGIAMGTPNYISPEQLKGMAIDRRADLFSLGVVIYEMLLGRRPFRGENITSLIYSIMNHEPEKPSDVNPQIPLLFDHIIAKALKKDPAARYQKAQDIANDLKEFVESFVAR